MRRYNILQDDPTTAGNGSKVIGAFRQDANEGRALAVEGDGVYCGTCKSVGRIVCVGPRLSDKYDGQEAALSDDICVCACEPSPRLINTANTMYQDVTVNEVGGSAAARSAAAISPLLVDNADQDVERYFEIVDAQTEVPIEGMTYKLSSGGHALIDDSMLTGGRTHAFSIKDHPNLAFVAWRAGDVR